MPTIEEAIQQAAFTDPAHRAQVNIIYTSNWLNQLTTAALRPYGLSLQQFNVLRILRGRGSEPSTVKLLTERMLDKMSNASRLVDKLREKGYVERKECASDRRRVDIVITEAGLRIVEEASRAVNEIKDQHFGRLEGGEYDELSRSLDKLRG